MRKPTELKNAAVKGIVGAVFLLTIFCLAGCTGKTPDRVQRQQTVLAQKEAPDSLAQRMAPAFVLSGAEERHNRIAAVGAMGSKGSLSIVLDPETPVIYTGSRSFATATGTYTNLTYRIHFSEQPFSLLPFHLGAGKHVGLLVVLTVDEHQQVLLVTTANTCGCYAVTIPTQSMPLFAYPEDWPTASFDLYGEKLPARLPSLDGNDLLLVTIRPEVHRVMGLEVVPRQTLLVGMVQAAAMRNIETLKHLPLEDGGITSFYYQRWPLKGHVKGAIKPWETLLLSVASLDLFIGMDKEYGDTEESGNPFYTSLKPWNRHRSDMNDFPRYLHYNGWRL